MTEPSLRFVLQEMCTLLIRVPLAPLDMLGGKLKILNQPIHHLQARHIQCLPLNQCRRPPVRVQWGIVFELTTLLIGPQVGCTRMYHMPC